MAAIEVLVIVRIVRNLFRLFGLGWPSRGIAVACWRYGT